MGASELDLLSSHSCLITAAADEITVLSQCIYRMCSNVTTCGRNEESRNSSNSHTIMHSHRLGLIQSMQSIDTVFLQPTCDKQRNSPLKTLYTPVALRNVVISSILEQHFASLRGAVNQPFPLTRSELPNCNQKAFLEQVHNQSKSSNAHRFQPF